MTQLSISSPSWRWPEWVEPYWDAIAALLCGLCLLAGWLTHWLDLLPLELTLLALVYLIDGDTSTEAGLTTLIIDGAVLILTFAVSGALEEFATQRTERNIRDLTAATPDVAWVMQGQQAQQVSVNQVSLATKVPPCW